MSEAKSVLHTGLPWNLAVIFAGLGLISRFVYRKD